MKTPRTTLSWANLAAVVALALFSMAPTPGDIGGCGQEPQQLDAKTFFGSKKIIDCRRCDSCGLHTDACQAACDDEVTPAEAFPEHCFPLVHDGEVCLRALYNASCDDYAGYVDDDPGKRTSPTECNFCPPR